MAKLVVVAISDRAVGAYLRPFYVRTRAEGARAFADEVNREGSEMQRHPEDYELHYLGEFDEGNGVFGEAVVETIVRASDVLRRVGVGEGQASLDFGDRNRGNGESRRLGYVSE